MSACAVGRRFLTLGQVAQECSVQSWQVLALFKRRLLPEPARLGAMRMIPAEDVAAIKAALEQAGYLRPDQGDAAGE